MSAALQQIEIRNADRLTIDIASKLLVPYCVSDPKSVTNAEKDPKSKHAQWVEKCFLIERDMPVVLKAGYAAAQAVRLGFEQIRKFHTDNNIEMTPEAVTALANPPAWGDFVQAAWEAMSITPEMQQAIDSRYMAPQSDKKDCPGQKKLDLSGQTSASIKPDEMAEGGPVRQMKIGDCAEGEAEVTDATVTDVTPESHRIGMDAPILAPFDGDIEALKNALQNATEFSVTNLDGSPVARDENGNVIPGEIDWQGQTPPVLAPLNIDSPSSVLIENLPSYITGTYGELVAVGGPAHIAQIKASADEIDAVLNSEEFTQETPTEELTEEGEPEELTFYQEIRRDALEAGLTVEEFEETHKALSKDEPDPMALSIMFELQAACERMAAVKKGAAVEPEPEVKARPGRRSKAKAK